jgi:hypothetical protein
MRDVDQSGTGKRTGKQDDAASRVRQLDPEARPEAVARFIAEIEAAEAVVQAVPIGDAALPVTFSAAWTGGIES